MIKNLIRSWLINSIVLSFAAEVFPGLFISNRLEGIIISGLALTLLNRFVKPLIKTILLPINLITFGTLKWIVNLIIFFILGIILPQLSIKPFYFSGFSWQGVSIQGFSVSYFFSLALVSFIVWGSKKAFFKLIKSNS
jgi:uncharacterized membrane protein YvlD (DUF360 family)